MTLRLPVQVHAALVKDAKKRETSLNQVIVNRLNRSLGGVYVSEEEANDGSILQRLKAIENWAKQQGFTSGQVEEEHQDLSMGMIEHGKKRLLPDNE